MAQIVDKIGNRWFGDQLQFYLHEWGKHTLGELYFTHQVNIFFNKIKNKIKGVKRGYGGQSQPLEYPQIAMPENIKFCKSFQIK